ncbi:MAG: peptidylprolyl isomerase [Marinifilaceae bacterium]|jgi:cyclophilin family peptidyl-prolyl cis-trans isomerase|nr:peptidylprolyl isomerase [Marinifilaceae bacterium]
MFNAIINTEKGEMTVALYDEDTPRTVENFIKLSREGFYDNLTFHRVIRNFVVQAGCPNGDGTGDPGYTIECETSAGNQYHDRGVLSMAHTGEPNTGGSQFFICHSRARTAHLDGIHTCFGRVIEGLEVVDKIRQGDRILSITIEEEEDFDDFDFMNETSDSLSIED